MIRIDRSRRDPDVWLGEKMLFFVTGAALGIGGMITGWDWLIYVAIVVLLVGFVLRLLGRRAQRDAALDGDDGPYTEADPELDEDLDEASDDQPADPPNRGPGRTSDRAGDVTGDVTRDVTGDVGDDAVPDNDPRRRRPPGG